MEDGQHPALTLELEHCHNHRRDTVSRARVTLVESQGFESKRERRGEEGKR